MTTLAEWLASAQAQGAERLDAQHLLAHTLGQARAWLLAHADAPLSPTQQQTLGHSLARLLHGEPLAYVLGEQEFHGLRLRVTPAVLVPRADTETLVEWALALLPAMGPARVLDLGTGSGAIALALKHACSTAQVTALDCSAEALAVARDNVQRLGLALRLLQSDWWGAVAGERFDLIVSNPPYIAAADAHLAGLQHEPLLALSPGDDGLGALRRIVADAPRHLQPGGWLLLEHGFDQATAVASMLREQGLQQVSTRRDLGGRERCTGGQLR